MLISDTAKLYPPLWGGPKRVWELFSNLPKAGYDITYIGIDSGQQEPIREIQAADNFLERRFSMPSLYYKIWLPVHNALFKDLSFDIFTYFFMSWAKQFAFAVKNQPADVIVASHPWAWPCLKGRSGVPFIYDAHNCEFLLMRSLAGTNRFGKLLTQRAKKIEADLCQKSQAILVCSQQDKDNFMDIYGINSKKIHVIPNGTSVAPLPSPLEMQKAKKALGLSSQPAILFVGAYYKPNIEAAAYILETLARSLPGCRFVIAGTVKHAFHDSKIPDNVIFTGLIDDESLKLYWQAADLAINPISKGSGVNIKMLDYMSAGIPTVSTPFGCRGLDVKHGRQVVLARLDGFADAVKTTLENPALCDKLRVKGHEFTADGYDWKAISNKLELILLNLLDNG